jgi:PEGA domain
MTITVDGPAHPRVTIDGAPIPESSLGVKRPADPGRHEIRSVASGYYTAKKIISLRDGESVKIAFELEDAPPDAKPKDEEQTGKVSVANIIDPPWRKPLTIGALAFGGVGLAVGGVTGIMAMTKRNGLVTRCNASSECGPDEKADFNQFHALATASTIGFVAGGVSAAAGVVLLLVRPQVLVQKPSTDQRDTKRAAVRWSPYVTGDSIGVQGSF